MGGLIEITGAREFERKAGFDNLKRNTAWLDHSLPSPAAGATAPAAVTPEVDGGSDGGGGGDDSGGGGGVGSGGVGGGGVAHALNAAAPAAVSPPALAEWRAAAAAGGAAVVPVAAETEGRLRRPVRSTAGHHPDLTAGPNPPPPQRKTKRPRTCR